MKIVVDTNVVISGTFFGGAPRRVVEAIGKKEIKACHALFDLEEFPFYLEFLLSHSLLYQMVLHLK